MQIVVNHLTKMEPDFVCVAGIDANTGKHVRPKQNRRLRLRDCASENGPFDMGAVVEIRRSRARPDPPEVEDHEYMLHDIGLVGQVGAVEFWNMLESTAAERLQDIFGRELRRVHDTCATSRGTGLASLGCVWPTEIVDLSVRRQHDLFGHHDSIRVELMMGRSRFKFPVNDLRLFQIDDERVNWLVNQTAFDSTCARIQHGVPVILSVGLSRPWQSKSADAPRHWLQVNNIHLADDPLWRLASGSAHLQTV